MILALTVGMSSPSVLVQFRSATACVIDCPQDGLLSSVMSTKSREVLFGSKLRGLQMRAKAARVEAKLAIAAAHKAACEEWSLRMFGFGGPSQPSPTIAQAIAGDMKWLEVKCKRCETRASIPLDCVRRPRDTPIWKLEASFRCRSCGTHRYRPPVILVRLTAEQEVTPYRWQAGTDR